MIRRGCEVNRSCSLYLRSRNISMFGAITWRDNKERAMNVADERSTSGWLQDAPAIKAPPLQTDQTCDVVVIGSLQAAGLLLGDDGVAVIRKNDHEEPVETRLFQAPLG